MSEYVAIQTGIKEGEAPAQGAEKDAQRFLEREIPALCRLTGLDVEVAIGRGWATNTEKGNFTIDPSFFTEKGYSAEDSVYASLHELLAHVRDVKRDPIYAARQREFSRQGEAQHLFNNILTDIHGNKFIHNLLPTQAQVAANLYANKLFPLEEDGTPIDYTTKPLHVQFLYKIIREEMIPESETPVRPEVDEAITSLRNYKGSGQDAIAYLTTPNANLSGSDRFDQQIAVIYPVYCELLEQAKEEAKDQQTPSESSNQERQNGEAEPQSGEGQSDQQDIPDQQPSSVDKEERSEGDATTQNGTDPSSNDNSDPFASEYADYFDNKHPEPMSEEEEKKLDEAIKEALDRQRPLRANPHRAFDQQIRKETGHSAQEYQAYKNEVAKHRQTIDVMRDVFRSVITERVAMKRGLSRRAYAEGDLLDPNRLPQTIADMKSGVSQPEAFKRYEHKQRTGESIGKTDYIFVFDRSGSMEGEKSAAAARSALIMLEALAGIERDIKEAERDNAVDLDLDIRTACYSFNHEVILHKPLSGGLTDKERLDTYSAVKRADGGNADSVVLADINRMEYEPDRRKICIVVSDGEADNPERARQTIGELRQKGWLIYGVAVGSQAAEQLYAPNSKLIANPEQLPDVLQSFIESAIT